MISEDTYVLTTKGLIQARFVNVGDKLITAMNNESEVLAIDKSATICNKKVITTYEDIYCSDDLLFQYKYGLKETIDYVFTIQNLIGWLNDIKNVKCKLLSIDGWIGNTRRIDDKEYDEYYNLGFRGEDLPSGFETLPFQLRLQILAGIIDSPCAKIDGDKVDITITKDTIYLEDILLLLRSLGYNIHIIKQNKKVHIVMHIDMNHKRIPLKTAITYTPSIKEHYPFEIEDVVDTQATLTYAFALSRPDEPILVGRMLIPCYIKIVD